MDNKGPRRLLVKHLLASATNRIMLHTLSREQLDAKWHALESLVYDRDRDVQMLALWQMAYICDACLDDPRAQRRVLEELHHRVRPVQDAKVAILGEDLRRELLDKDRRNKLLDAVGLGNVF